MKTLIAGAIALSLLAGAASAQPYDHQEHRQDGQHQGRDDHRGDGPGRGQDGPRHWNRGDRLPANYRTRDHYVDYRAHHLRAPPRGYRWVQADNNYALVAVTTGLIASIIANSN